MAPASLLCWRASVEPCARNRRHRPIHILRLPLYRLPHPLLWRMDRYKKKRPSSRTALGALLLLLGSATALPSAAATADGVRVFAEAMARMMDAMGMLGDGGDAPMPLPPAAMPGVGAPMGMEQMPWSGVPGANPSDWSAWMQQLPGMVQLPNAPGWQRTSLDGLWEGRDGGLLIVQAHRFRLYARRGDYIEGLIQQRGDRIALYDAEHDLARPYEFAQHQGRLVLRDPAGQVYLYRRLWLEEIGDGGGAGPER